MKNFFALGILTLALVTVSHQQAHAWSNIKFGAGVNLQWQTGDNTLFWGLFRNGQVPHPYGGGVPPHMMAPQGYAPAPAVGASLQGVPQASPAAYQQQNTSGYQPVGYTYPTYNSYYSSSSYQIPSYWYGR